MWAQVVNVLVGLWLMAAPAVLGYHGLARTSDRIVGPIAATIATIAISEATRPVRWANVACGAWLLLVPWVAGAGTAAAVNSLAVGVVLIACAAVRGRRRQRLGGGWRAVLAPVDAPTSRDPGA